MHVSILCEAVLKLGQCLKRKPCACGSDRRKVILMLALFSLRHLRYFRRCDGDESKQKINKADKRTNR